MKSTSSKPTQIDLAKALGISPRRVRQLIAEKGMPTDSIASALAWRTEKAEGAETASGECDELRRERIRLTKAQASKAEFALEVEKGKFLAREKVIEDSTRISTALAAFIARLILELPGLVEGLPRNRSAPIISQRVRQLQDTLSNSQSEFWKAHPLKK